MTGRNVVVTGATSGLGTACARDLVQLGARLTLIARSQAKAEATCAQLVRDTPGAQVDYVLADMGELAEVQRAAMTLLSRYEKLDVLVHNAGALDSTYSATREGTEQTIATHVVGPYMLTSMLLPILSSARPAEAVGAARILWVSSGGMYAEPLDVDSLEMGPEGFDGVKAYAKAKRAQVTLSEMMAQAFAPAGLRVHAMHPGWADTPGIARSLPTFRKLTRPLLRTPEQGADTLVWLAASDGQPLQETGKFWFDRTIRSIHKLAKTRKADTPQARAALWNWVEDRASVCAPSLRPPVVSVT
ncbi:MAG: SDR family NAD(P)-dependent oxidoreductase [Polyangiaceae bacterium]|nr:SDR family NAD(P)-dependent oxidoreductase [Polyangiaceae bacterium]